MAVLGPEVALRRQRILDALANGEQPDRDGHPGSDHDAVRRAPSRNGSRPADRAADPSLADASPVRDPKVVAAIARSTALLSSRDLPMPGRGWVERLRDESRDIAVEDRRARPAARPTPPPAAPGSAAESALALLADATEHPVPLTGDDGLITTLIGDVLRRGLEIELQAHLGHGRWEFAARGAVNIRNGAYTKRVATDIGTVVLQMPRDRQGTFEPVIVPKHGRRLSTPGSHLIAIFASGMSRQELRSLMTTLTQGRLARETLETLLDDLIPSIRAWQSRRLAAGCPVLLLDTVALHGRGLRTSRRMLDVAIGLDAFGGAELLGLWRRGARPGAERWRALFDDLRDRGLDSVDVVAAAPDPALDANVARSWPDALVVGGVDAAVENLLRHPAA